MTTQLFSPGAHGLIGPNKAGKTTYLNNYFRSKLGTGLVAMAQTGNRNIFAGAHLGDHFSVVATAYPKFDRTRALQLVSEIGLTDRSRIGSLSTGQRQMAAFASALATNAPILLLDEPFNGLDVTQRNRIRDELIDLLTNDKEVTLVLTSHRSEDLAGLVTDVTVINHQILSPTHSLETSMNNFPTLTGPSSVVDGFREDIIARKSLGDTTSITLSAPLSEADVARAGQQDIHVTYPSEQNLIDLLIGASNAN